MRLHRQMVLAIAVAAILCTVVAGAYADDYYVDKTGDNSAGLSWATAWHTV